MKKQWIILVLCLVAAGVLCAMVSFPGKSEGYFFTTAASTAGTQNTSDGTQPSGTHSTNNPSRPTDTGTEPTAEPAEVRLYICQQEDPAIYEQLAQEYTALTGVNCQILTGDLEALMENQQMPTLFCIHSQAQAEQWQDRMLDLTGQSILQQLYSPAFALYLADKPVALAMDVTTYGVVYNTTLLGMSGYTREDIVDLASFRQVVEAVTESGNAIGFKTFAYPDSADSRFAAMLLSTGHSGPQLRELVDLILENDTHYDDALDAFVTGKTVFYVGGAWEYETFSQLGIHNLDILPFYSEDGSTLPCICDTYWAINSQSGEGNIQAALAFMQWLVTATEEAAPVDRLGLDAPFLDAQSGDRFMRQLIRKYLLTESVTVGWTLEGDYSQEELQSLARKLEAYIASPTDENWAALEALLK